MAATLLTDLVPDVRASSLFFAGATTDDQVVRYIIQAVRQNILDGLNFIQVGGGPMWDTITITNPDISSLMHPLRAIIVLQAKILALKANPLKEYKITGMNQVFNTDQVLDDENTLRRMILDYYADLNPTAFVVTEFDQLGSTDLHLRTLRSVLFPSPIPLFDNPA